ncbi:MAG: hypothetical protein AB8I08_33995 [Sandaracinaceae bacterium]
MHPRIIGRVVGQAWVVDNPLASGMVRAFLWISPRPWTSEVFSESADARRWLDERLEMAKRYGVPGP